MSGTTSYFTTFHSCTVLLPPRLNPETSCRVSVAPAPMVSPPFQFERRPRDGSGGCDERDGDVDGPGGCIERDEDVDGPGGCFERDGDVDGPRGCVERDWDVDGPGGFVERDGSSSLAAPHSCLGPYAPLSLRLFPARFAVNGCLLLCMTQACLSGRFLCFFLRQKLTSDPSLRPVLQSIERIIDGPTVSNVHADSCCRCGRPWVQSCFS